MYKWLVGGFFLLGVMSTGASVSALSCVTPLPTFDDMVAEGAVVMYVDVEDVTFLADNSEADYCENVGGDISRTGTHTYDVSVTDVIRGPVDGISRLSRTVDGINCTWGGYCDEMVAGQSYLVVTDLEGNIGSGLCGPCPYERVENDPVEENVCICTMQYEPECGLDGQTYGNGCQRECAGADLDYVGECGTDPVGFDPAIPTTCTSWFDGCNTCMVEESVIGGCTKLACVQQQTPYCKVFDFDHVTPQEVEIVNSLVMNYMEKYEGEVKSEKKSTVFERIEKKRQDIMDILMRSTFVVGSPELKKYNFTLEALDAIEHAVKRS